MNTKWFKHDRSAAQREETKQLLVLCKPVLDNLAEVCYNSIKKSDTLERTQDIYDTPNWSHKQADLNGYKRAYHEIIAMIESIED